MDRVKVVVYTESRAEPPAIALLIQQLERQKDQLEFEVLTDPAAVVGTIETTSMTVLILTLKNKDEFLEILNMLSRVQSRIQAGLLRATVLNGMNHPRVIALLRAKGVHEIIELNPTIKSLNHKIKNAFLVVTQNFQRLRQSSQRATTGGAESSRRGASRADSVADVQWGKPVEHPCDFWSIPSTKQFRNVMGRWLIDLVGPGPAIGGWEETVGERAGERAWVWKKRDSTDLSFTPKPGRWVFYGRQPEFIWQRNIWAFVSRAPHLAFYVDGEKPEYVRIELSKAGGLFVLENSEVSQSFLPMIQASLDASMTLTGEAPKGALTLAKGDVKSKWRDALQPGEALGNSLGLIGFHQTGVLSGPGSFDRLHLHVQAQSRNGEALTFLKPLSVMELTKSGITFELPTANVRIHDYFRFHVEFRWGDVEKTFEIEVVVESVLSIEEAGSLVFGQIAGGDTAGLAEVLEQVAKRELELHDFFSAAKGA